MQAGADLDAALVDACRGGDHTAFAQIIERYHRAVYAVAFSSARDRALADDITQETFVTAWRRLDDLRDKARLPAWLCGIARNIARDLRKRSRRETVGGDVAEPIDATTPYDAMTEVEEERLIATALGQVPEVYREPLVLYYYEDRSVDDVARCLGITAATTNKRLSRGRQYLAARVATIVERGVARRGPHPALAASVLAIIGVTAPASHVDASPVKGSTMHKLAIATAITAALGGGAILVATTSSSGDAHAGPKTATAARDAHGKPGKPEACDTFGALAAAGAHASHAARASAPASPALPTSLLAGSGSAATSGTADCVAVGQHLAELEADMTHGPDERPDIATCDKCAAFYTALCEKEAWPAARRSCAMAAADLINAHLCAEPAGAAPASPPPTTTIPPALACEVIGPSLANMAQAAGLYSDIPDLHEQVVNACELGNWSLELRQCFAQATSVVAAQACLAPAK